MEGIVRFNDLRSAYEESFFQFCTEVRTLRFAERNGDEEDTDLLTNLRERVHAAEKLYRERRDELAQYIISRQEYNETASV